MKAACGRFDEVVKRGGGGGMGEQEEAKATIMFIVRVGVFHNDHCSCNLSDI